MIGNNGTNSLHYHNGAMWLEIDLFVNFFVDTDNFAETASRQYL
jgi:hypothetical protein